MDALHGRRIVVTRAAHQQEELAAPLTALGAEVLRLPLLVTAPPSDLQPLRAAAQSANSYDWIVFTSANAVAAFRCHLLTEPNQMTARVAAIGPGTQVAAEALGLHVSLVPPTYIAEALVDAFSAEPLTGARILIPRAAIARDVVPVALRQRGAIVDVVEAYQTIWRAEAAGEAHQMFTRPLPDWVTLASASAAEHLVSILPVDTLQQLRFATIGPITTSALARHGLRAVAEANPHTIDGLVAALLSQSRSQPQL